MSSASFRNIFVPTLISSSVFFYALITAFNLTKLQPTPETSPLPTNRLQYIASKETKDLTIRNVGFCILGSVGAGLIVAEVSRKLHRRRQLSQSLTPQAVQPAVFHAPVDHQPNGKALSHPVFDSESAVDEGSFERHETEWVTLPSIALEDSDLLISQPAQQGQTCRISVPHLKQSLFAIKLNGEYYSFARAEKNREKALRTVARLFDRGDRAIITEALTQYIIWVWQPQAKPAIEPKA